MSQIHHLVKSYLAHYAYVETIEKLQNQEMLEQKIDDVSSSEKCEKINF